jgi:UDP-N-acetyl-D-galactosamine dehydrogenase
MKELKDIKLAVIGLGYVGLPLAVEFGKYLDVVGFDINKARVTELENGHDSTLEVENEMLKLASRLSYSSDVAALKECNTYIVTVPTQSMMLTHLICLL